MHLDCICDEDPTELAVRELQHEPTFTLRDKVTAAVGFASLVAVASVAAYFVGRLCALFVATWG